MVDAAVEVLVLPQHLLPAVLVLGIPVLLRKARLVWPLLLHPSLLLSGPRPARLSSATFPRM